MQHTSNHCNFGQTQLTPLGYSGSQVEFEIGLAIDRAFLVEMGEQPDTPSGTELDQLMLEHDSAMAKWFSHYWIASS